MYRLECYTDSCVRTTGEKKMFEKDRAMSQLFRFFSEDLYDLERSSIKSSETV